MNETNYEIRLLFTTQIKCTNYVLGDKLPKVSIVLTLAQSHIPDTTTN